MRKWIGVALLALGLQRPAGAVEAIKWFTDLPTAQAKAKAENRCILIDFTGSDWCPWCIRLREEVFDKPEFAAYAEAKLVLVEIDFPRRIKQSSALKAANEKLSARYGIEGYPTILVLDSNGRKIGQAGYQPGGPTAFLATLDRFPGMKELKATAGTTRPPANGRPPEVSSTVQTGDSSKNGKPAADPVTGLDGIALKAISGPKDHRLALINSEPVSAGERVRIKVGDQTVEITCVEVRESSVVIRVQGRIRELTMGGKF